ncbi:MAG TPA: hypothetical protein VI685_19175, partial [Candidatus Angelobacter sp.]
DGRMAVVRRSRIFSGGVYIVLFFAALTLADYVLGPLCIKFWPNIPSGTYQTEIERAYLFGINSLALFLTFLPFARVTATREIDGPFMAMSWVASPIAVGVYYLLLIRDHSSPPLYKLFATDLGELEWLLVNVITALLPVACWLAVFLASRYRRPFLRSA